MQTAQTPRVLRGMCRGLAGLAVLPLALLSGCQTAEGTGAVAGGAGGAVLGNVIAKAAHGSRTAGTVIGGAVGAIGGALVGNKVDRADARARQAEAQAAAASAQPALSVPDVVQLSQQGVTPTVIINQIRTTGSVYHLTSADLVYLQQNGVSSAVIGEMQATATRVPRRVYVEQPVVQPVYVAQPPPVSLGVGVGFGR